MPVLPEYITIEEAARRYQVDPQVLTERVNSGKIKAVRIDGAIALAEEDVRALAEDLALRARVAHLKGRQIRLKEAAQKYGLSTANLCRWAYKGYIRILDRKTGKGRKRELYLDEGDVAYASLLAEQGNLIPGKALFSNN